MQWHAPIARYELALYNELVRRGIKPIENCYAVIKNDKIASGDDNQTVGNEDDKYYYLDIAVWKGTEKLNIEVDGFHWSHIYKNAQLHILDQLAFEDNYTSAQISVNWRRGFRYVNRKIPHTKQLKLLNWYKHNLEWCIQNRSHLLSSKDIRRTDYLERQGWNVLRFWNEEVETEINRCVDQIERWLNDSK